MDRIFRKNIKPEIVQVIFKELGINNDEAYIVSIDYRGACSIRANKNTGELTWSYGNKPLLWENDGDADSFVDPLTLKRCTMCFNLGNGTAEVLKSDHTKEEMLNVLDQYAKVRGMTVGEYLEQLAEKDIQNRKQTQK